MEGILELFDDNCDTDCNYHSANPVACMEESTSTAHEPVVKSAPKSTKYERKLAAINSDYSLELFSRRSSSLVLDCVRLVVHQLGYLPLNLICIGAGVDIGRNCQYPLVAIVYPLNGNNLNGRYLLSNGLKPFPTTMWMTCPYLHARISKLEDMGYVTIFQNRLSNATEEGKLFIGQMQRAHALYAEYRWNLLADEDIQIIDSTPGWRDALSNVGVAGIRNYDSVKCLHCHYAHFRCFPEHGNIVGKWVQEVLDTMDIEDGGSSFAKLLSNQIQFYDKIIGERVL